MIPLLPPEKQAILAQHEVNRERRRLRDEFAMAALQRLIVAFASDQHRAEIIAEAYLWADAMLAQREKVL